ncbi:hypothetical protein M422DRAFT_167345 [Sphaerobolus stellatus SS14]|uniref:LYR motif-containing protein 2 n=1 Tax=Sphaerobolus stellatus (strain SS14) TaxID=990650 RepID=A0A0C9UQE0_SPHS4|nr:hypothetical protein M422DRAFT_167345 [Sphaerobolus stellatus SS14]
MLTLQHFVLRTKALNMYRAAIRTSKGIPDPTARRETIAWIRTEFEQAGQLEDIDAIKSRLSSLRRDLKEILPSFGLTSSKSDHP